MVPKQEKQCLSRLAKMGITNFKAFSSPLTDIFTAISRKDVIEDIDIAQAVRDSDFRFYSKLEPRLSLDASNAIASTVAEISKPSPTYLAKGRQVRTQKADAFAKEMFIIIKDIRENEGVRSLHKTILALESRNVRTSLGGQWHVNTLQMLKKRWKKLGLTP